MNEKNENSNEEKIEEIIEIELLRLKKWFKRQISFLIPSWLILILWIIFQNELLGIAGGVLILGTLICYFPSLYLSYRIQYFLYESELHEEKPTNTLIMGIMLNPFVLGFIIPLQIIKRSKKAIS